MVDSEQHSRFSPEVNPKLGAKIINKVNNVKLLLQKLIIVLFKNPLPNI